MRSIKESLSKWLKDATKIAIVGVGNPLRADDYVGIAIINRLSKIALPRNVYLFDCQTSPENYIKQIEKCSPSHIILIDAAQLDEPPGEVKLVPPDRIKGVSLSTHTISLSLIAEFFMRSIKTKVILIAIQPKNINFNEGLTPYLDEASTRITKILSEVLISDLQNR